MSVFFVFVLNICRIMKTFQDLMYIVDSLKRGMDLQTYTHNFLYNFRGSRHTPQNPWGKASQTQGKTLQLLLCTQCDYQVCALL